MDWFVFGAGFVVLPIRRVEWAMLKLKVFYIEDITEKRLS